MPISEQHLPRPGDGAHASPEGAYGSAVADFTARNVTLRGWAGAVEAFHAVCEMPYFSGPDRTPAAALRTGRGACTAKHILLRDLLRELGFEARVELVECDFAHAVPPHASMPGPLRATAAEGNIRDIHCWVRLQDGAHDRLLDATWPSGMAAYGFPVNDDWNGRGDTRPAVADGVVRDTAEDVVPRKEALLAEFSREETEARRVFLKRLSAWLDGLPARDREGEAT